MKRPKTKRQIYFERIIKIVAFVFIFGVLCGMGTFKLIHNCNINTVEATEIIVENESTEPVEVIVPEPINTLYSLGTFKLTAYCACIKCCGKSDGITASGAKAVEGVTVAADTRFPFGTKIIIDGHEYTVQDRGGAVKGDKIDIYFNSHTEALKFGVQYKEVFIG